MAAPSLPTLALCLLVAAPLSVFGAECTEEAVRDRCHCNHYSRKGWQCSTCKDSRYWGYGCDMECDSYCENGCDMIGNCITISTANCKRNNRYKDNPTGSKEVLNEHGDCQNCKDKYWGPKCEFVCASNCDTESVEGWCTRSGKCYRCKKGYYGDKCTEKCPEACQDCLMKATSDMPAGACPGSCEDNKFGNTCEEDCPTNCRKYPDKSSCDKVSGKCWKCQDKKFYGEKCLTPCAEGCDSGICDKDSGVCIYDCRPGYWGDKCDGKCSDHCKNNQCNRKTGRCIEGCDHAWFGEDCTKGCPDGTDGECDRITGMPEKCKPGMYPDYKNAKDKTPVCRNCSENCANNKCDQEGKCLEGCVLGFSGVMCQWPCPVNCVGPCDAYHTETKDGYCIECVVGKTGKQCTKDCHPSCKSCQQRGDSTGPTKCLSCYEDQPTYLKGSGLWNDKECAGIDRTDCDSGTSMCKCAEPDDEMLDAFFQQRPYKECKWVCKDGYKDVFKEKEHTCVTHQLFKAVVQNDILGKEFAQGNCPSSDDIQIEVNGDYCSTNECCLHKGYVDYIIND